MRKLFFLLCLIAVSASGQGVAVRAINGKATNMLFDNGSVSAPAMASQTITNTGLSFGNGGSNVQFSAGGAARATIGQGGANLGPTSALMWGGSVTSPNFGLVRLTTARLGLTNSAATIELRIGPYYDATSGHFLDIGFDPNHQWDFLRGTVGSSGTNMPLVLGVNTNVAIKIDTNNSVQIPNDLTVGGTLSTPTLSASNLTVGTFNASTQNLSGALTADSAFITNRVRQSQRTLTYTGSGASGTNVLVDCSLGNWFKLTATNHAHLLFTNIVEGYSAIINIRQDATGNRLISYNSVNVKTNATITLTTNASALDVIYLASDDIGTNLTAVLHGNFK